ncbi:hypothetical protein KNO15_01545 [Leifsonia shinshuensis]|uniref:hypothetical protein n=1 Tax=Leifsonia shinshuensis TaxID=150026 RepID=UPI001F50AC5A|nr:hypothetical protein [Leifsonia shinshuensis]MCI0155380.1 hypothetical protein [Leifsonia shinshuensis]
MPPPLASSHPSTGVSRRTLVGAAAWTTPAIVLATAAPAYATSTLGLITFVDPEDIIGSGYTATLAVQLTVPTGGSVPTHVTVGYSTPGVLSGPTTVPTGGKTLFTFPVKALDVNDSTAITVRADGYVDATTTITVTHDNSGIYLMSALIMNQPGAGNQVDSAGPGTRTVNANGFLVDSWIGAFERKSTAAANWLKIGGQLSRGTPPAFKEMKGRLDWNLSSTYTGSPNLVWAGKPGDTSFAFHGQPLGGSTFQSGTASSNGTLSVPVAVVRSKLTNTANPGGWAYFFLTFPRFPNYVATWRLSY